MTEASGSPEPAGAPVSDPAIVAQTIARLRDEQDFNLGLAAGLVAALIGAALWAGVTIVTKYQIGWMAVGVGFLVGFAVRRFGRGIEPRFGYLGAALALVGCALGNLFAVLGIVAGHESVSFFSLLGQVRWTAVPRIMAATFNPMDVLFYGIALYEGYKLSFRQLTTSELGLPGPAGPGA